MIENVIVVCDYGYIEGGAARIAHETAVALKGAGLNVSFFCAVGPVSGELLFSGVNVVCLDQADILHEKNRLKGVFRGLNNKKAKKRFSAVLKDYKPENTVVHVHTWTKALSSSVFKAAKKRGFKVLITVHDYFLVCPNGGLFNYRTREICKLKPMSSRCVACNCDSRSYLQKLFRVWRQRVQNRNIRRNKNISYAFISEFSKREFLKRFDKIPADKQYFLPNMVGFEKEDRARVECENNELYLFIGGVTEVKGIRIFCEAVNRANVPAVVIGDGILRKELEEKYPDIEFVGWKSKQEMTPYLLRARCMIFSSIWYETMGLTPLEVMLYGIPVICSELNAASEYIFKEMQYDGSVDGLVNKIKELSDDNLVKDVGERIFKDFDFNVYSKDNYLNGLINLYNDII